VQAEPRLLDGIVGLCQGSEHPVGDGAQVSAVIFEFVGQEVASGHCHIPSLAFVLRQTDQMRSM
jgi:hypothetical protein